MLLADTFDICAESLLDTPTSRANSDTAKKRKEERPQLKFHVFSVGFVL